MFRAMQNKTRAWVGNGGTKEAIAREKKSRVESIRDTSELLRPSPVVCIGVYVFIRFRTTPVGKQNNRGVRDASLANPTFPAKKKTSDGPSQLRRVPSCNNLFFSKTTATEGLSCPKKRMYFIGRIQSNSSTPIEFFHSKPISPHYHPSKHENYPRNSCAAEAICKRHPICHNE